MNDPNVVAVAPNLTALLSETLPSAGSPDNADRARGTLLGLAAGNLLGLPVESTSHHRIAGRHPDGLTEIDPAEAHRRMDDDLAQAVDLGESLLAGGDYVQDFSDRLDVWARENGRGIGITTEEVIEEIRQGAPTPEPARRVYERKNGIAPNGGVMRCAPVAIARHDDPERLVSDSAATCVVTHYAATCQWSCIIVNAVISQLLHGIEPDLPAILAAAAADGCPDLLAASRRDGIPTAALDAIAAGTAPPSDVDWLMCNHRLIGHTLLALQYGLWATTTGMNFEDALVASVATGGDTDTNAAVAGAVLGARYGASSIPGRWLDCIPQRERIESLAANLALSSRG